MRWVPLAILVLAAAPVAGGQGAPDEEDPPVLASVRLSATHVEAGHTIVVTLGLSDASGLGRPFVELRGPAENLRVHSNEDCEDGAGRTTASLRCPFALSPTLPAGTYEVLGVQVSDLLWNTAHLEAGRDFQDDADHDLSFTVRSDNHDLDGPVLERIEVVTPAVAAGSNVTFRVHASDATGLLLATFGIQHRDGSPWTSGPCWISGTSGAFDCPLPIPATFPAGTYAIESLGLTDVNGIPTHYGQSPSIPSLLPGAGNVSRFTVESPSHDTGAPRLLRFEAPLLPVLRGQEYEVKVWATDAEGVDFVFMVFENDVGRRYWRKHLDVQPVDCTPWQGPQEPMTCADRVADDFPLGEVRLMTLFLKDPATNEAIYVHAESGVHGTPVAEDGLNRTSFWIGPRSLQVPELPSLLRLEPAVVEIASGTVLPVAGALDGVTDVANLTFSFLSDAGGRLEVLACEPTARPDPSGFACGLILPPGVEEGRYVLDQVLLTAPDGTVLELGLPADPPSFTVTLDPEADAGAPLPEDWSGLVRGTTTLAPFNSGPALRPLRSDVADAGPAEDSVEDAPEPGDGVDPGPAPKRPAPATPVALAVLALACAALLVRRSPRQRR